MISFTYTHKGPSSKDGYISGVHKLCEWGTLVNPIYFLIFFPYPVFFFFLRSPLKETTWILNQFRDNFWKNSNSLTNNHEMEDICQDDT